MAKQTWVSVYGNVQIADGMITHLPVAALATTNDMPPADSAPTQPP